VGLAPYHDFEGEIPAELDAEVQAIVQGIIDGEISTGWPVQ
jgi:basic membrane protein A